MILALVSHVPSILFNWWMISNAYHETFLVYQLIFYASYVPLNVLLPFAVMFVLSEKNTSKPALRTIMISAFFGCWLGSVIGLVSQQVILYVRDVNQFYTWASTIWIGWSVLSGAFSYTFFVSLSAILFAFYKNTQDQAVPSTPLQPL